MDAEEIKEALIAGIGGAAAGGLAGIAIQTSGILNNLAPSDMDSSSLPPVAGAALGGALVTVGGLSRNRAGKIIRSIFGTPPKLIGKAIVKSIQATGNSIVDGIKAIPGKIQNAAVSQVERTKQDIQAIPGRVQDAAKRKAQETAEEIKALPSKVSKSVAEAAENAVEYAVEEVKATPGKVVTATKEAIDRTVDETQAKISQTVEDIVTFPERTIESLFSEEPRPPKLPPPPPKMEESLLPSQGFSATSDFLPKLELKAPKIELPKVDLSRATSSKPAPPTPVSPPPVKTPSFSIPKVELPEISLPSPPKPDPQAAAAAAAKKKAAEEKRQREQALKRQRENEIRQKRIEEREKQDAAAAEKRKAAIASQIASAPKASSPRPSFSILGGGSSAPTPAPKKAQVPKSDVKAPSPTFSLFGNSAPAPSKKEEPKTKPAPTFSLFNSQPKEKKEAPAAKQPRPSFQIARSAPEKPKPKPKPRPSFQILGGSPAAPAPTNAPTPTPAAKAPRGIPTIVRWKQRRDGGITGKIYGSPNFDDGDRVETTKIESGTIANGQVVKTGSGSRYFLSDTPPKINQVDRDAAKSLLGAIPGATITLTKQQREKNAKAAETQLKAASSSQTFSLFGLGGQSESSAPPVAPKAKPSPQKKAASASSTASVKKAPRGVPTLNRWKKNRDGSITGLITGSSSFADGERVTTSPIASGTTASGEVVQTGSGSRYFLS